MDITDLRARDFIATPIGKTGIRISFRVAPTETVQRAAYSIHGACADILGAVNEVTDPHAAYEIWQMVETAWRAVDAVAQAAQAKAEQLNKEQH